jgi:hypothetical protein
MAVKKVPIDPDRVRKIPREGFSWIDRRFVREGFIDQLPGEAILLYFFLVAVSDTRGLSFYADPTVSRILKLNAEQLTQARARLVAAKLILYRYPHYQVLPLPETPKISSLNFTPQLRAAKKSRGGDPVSLNELLKLEITNSQNPYPNKSKETK